MIFNSNCSLKLLNQMSLTPIINSNPLRRKKHISIYWMIHPIASKSKLSIFQHDTDMIHQSESKWHLVSNDSSRPHLFLRKTTKSSHPPQNSVSRNPLARFPNFAHLQPKSPLRHSSFSSRCGASNHIFHLSHRRCVTAMR